MTQELWIQPIRIGKNRFGVDMVAIPVKCQVCGCEYQHDFPEKSWADLGTTRLYQDAGMTPLCPVCWKIESRAAFRVNQRVATPFGEGVVAVNADKVSVDVGESTFVLPAEQVEPLPSSDPVKDALIDKIKALEEELAIHRQAIADAQADVLVLKEERNALRESLTEARAEIGKRVMVGQKVDVLFTTETRYFSGKIATPESAQDTAQRLDNLKAQGWKVVYEQFHIEGTLNHQHFARLEREVERDAAPDPLEEHAAVPVPVVPTKRVVGGLIFPVTSPDTAIQNRLDTIRADEETQLAQTYMNTFNAFMAATPRPTWKPLGGEQS